MARVALPPEEAKARAAARARAWKESPEGRAYYATHRAQINAAARAWRARNRDKENARQKLRMKLDPDFKARHRAADDKWRAKIDKKAYWKRIRDKQNADPVRRAQRKLWAKKAYEKYKQTPGGRAKRARADENRRLKLAADATLRERQRIHHREYSKAWRARKLAAKKEAANAKARARRERNREHIRATASAWREKNRERIRELSRAYQKTPAFLAQAKAYRDRTKDRQRERHRIWREKQPDYKAKKRAYMLDYNATRRVKDPEAGRKAWERLRADPVRYAAYKQANNRRRTSSPRVEALPYPYNTAKQSPILEQVLKLIPRHIPAEIRGDLCQAILSDLFAETLTLDQLAQKKVMSRYTSAAWDVFGDRDVQSIYDVIPGTENLKRIDTVAAGTSIFTATQYKRGRKAKRPSIST